MKVYEVWREKDMCDGRAGQILHSTYSNREEAVAFMDRQWGLQGRMPHWFCEGATWSNQSHCKITYHDWFLKESEIEESK